MPSPPQNYRILVVDDEPLSIELLVDTLSDDYLVECVESGEEALNAIPQFQPDLVLLDVLMPGIDGYEVCRRLRQDVDFHDVKIIMVTGKSSSEDKIMGYKAGTDDYIAKPFDINELEAKIKVFQKFAVSRGIHPQPSSTPQEKQGTAEFEKIARAIRNEKDSNRYRELSDRFEKSLQKLDKKEFVQVSENEEVVKSFNRFSSKIKVRLALFGNLKNKSQQELEFLSEMKINPKLPNSSVLFDRKGGALHLLGKYDEAISCFNEAIRNEHKTPSIFFRRAEAKFKKELYLAAQEDYNNALDLDKKEPHQGRLSKEALSKIKISNQKIKEIEQEFIEVLNKDPNHYDANRRIATVYQHATESRQNIEKGILYLERAVEIEPDRPEAYMDLARANFKIACMIGGNTLPYYYDDPIDRVHYEHNCDEESHQSIIFYCEKALSNTKEALDKSQNHKEIYELRGDLFKIMGDNKKTAKSKQNKEQIFFSRSIENTEKLALDSKQLSATLYRMLPLMMHFKTFDAQQQKHTMENIVKQIKQLTAQAFQYKSEERRRLFTLAADFFFGTGKYKMAIDLVNKLKEIELKAGIDSQSFCKDLLDEYVPHLKNIQSQKEVPSTPLYTSALENYQAAIKVQVDPKLRIKTAVVNLCLLKNIGFSNRDEKSDGLSRSAFELCSKAIEEDPKSKPPFYIIADILTEARQLKEAAGIIGRGIKIFGEDPVFLAKKQKINLIAKSALKAG